MNRRRVALLVGVLLLGCTEKELGPTFRTWRVGDTVPGYVLSEPSGSAADVEAKGQMWDSWWALEWKTKSAVGGAAGDDHLFRVDSSIAFSLYISDASDSAFDGKNVIHLAWANSGDSPESVYVYYLDGADPPVIDGSRDGIWDDPIDETELSLDPLGGTQRVTTAYLGAAYDIDTVGAVDSIVLYVHLSWQDPSGADVSKDAWLLTDDGFAREGEEDVAILMFPTDDPPSGWDTSGGGVFFPASTHPSDGEVNIWLWGAGRTNPMGYADDQFADATSWRSDAGETVFTQNYSAGVGYPLWVQNPSVSPSFGEEFLLEEEAIPFEETLRP